MSILYLECLSGVSGDMLLGALLDMGVPEAQVRGAIEAFDLPGWKLELATVEKGGIRALRAHVEVDDDRTSRSYADVEQLLARSSLADGVHRRAAAAFEFLAIAEARVHQADPDGVEFHEVGSLDAIVDIVGVSAALEYLAPDRVVTSPIATGSGWVPAAHGQIPIPAPAVVEIASRCGAMLFGRGRLELATPTGVALLAAATTDFGELPLMRLGASGYGAGSHDIKQPNVLRALLGEEIDSLEQGTALLMEANLDDMNPELIPYVIDLLMQRGAQDAWVTPVLMKKGRPAFVLSILVDPGDRERISEAVFRETTTLGLRTATVTKSTLERSWIEVEVAGHGLMVKLGRWGARIVTAAPEYEAAAEVARSSGVPLREVYALAQEAARAAQPG